MALDPVRRVYISGPEVYVSKKGIDAITAARENKRGLLMSLNARNYQVIQAGYILLTHSYNATAKKDIYSGAVAFALKQTVIPDVIAQPIRYGDAWAAGGYDVPPEYDMGGYDEGWGFQPKDVWQLTVSLTGATFVFVKDSPWYWRTTTDIDKAMAVSYAVFRRPMK